jgi:hypothetical protein
MRLSAFRVRNYKVIDDTGWIAVDGNVTAFVGRNESGKTAVLRALWKSRNVAAVKFDKLIDYPRERYAKERKGSQEVTSLRFDLLPAESESLSAQFPAELNAKPRVATLTTYYVGEDNTRSEVLFEGDIENLCRIPSDDAKRVVQLVSDALKPQDPDSVISNAATTALAQINDQDQLWSENTGNTLAAFEAAVSGWAGADENRRFLSADERQECAKVLAKARQGDPSAKPRQWILDNLPIFIYFDDYGQLDTRIFLPAYLGRATASPDVRTRTQSALFAWSGLDPAEVLDLGHPRAAGESEEQVQRRKDKRRILLESASFSLTGDWIDWWTEKRHRLHFDADGEDLVLNVSDEHNQFPIPFEERSHGLQWFFSFYLVFLVESQHAHKGAILLLDEPGLHIHPSLQAKLLDLFDRISKTNQLLYSTHLPFLVDGDHLERVRTVYLAGKDLKKTTVSEDLRAGGDRDTLFPLQAAIGYSIAQTLFLGKRSLIVEGLTDYWLLKAMDNCLAVERNGVRLHEDTVIIPAGGTSKMMPLASIMLSTSGVGGRSMLILLDSDTEGGQAAKRFEHDLFSDNSRILMLGAATGLTTATIEDLIPREDYASAVRATGYSFELNADDTAAKSNLAAMEQVFSRCNYGKFGTDQKATVALKLIDLWGKDPSSVPSATRDLASKLFAAVNDKFQS